MHLYLSKSINMDKNLYEGLTDAELLKKRNLMKGVAIGLGVVALVAAAILVYLGIVVSGKTPAASWIPVVALQVSFVPVLIALGKINQEVKARNLK